MKNKIDILTNNNFWEYYQIGTVRGFMKKEFIGSIHIELRENDENIYHYDPMANIFIKHTFEDFCRTFNVVK